MKFNLNRRDFIKLAGGAMAGLFLSGGDRKPGDRQESGPYILTLKDQPPNVLLIVLDTVRAKSLSLFNYGRQTSPQLRKLSQRGVLFKNAMASSPWTLPSHASMFTGQWPNKLSAAWYTPLDDSYPVIAEVFHANGYETAGFIANRDYCSREFGLSRGYEHYEDFRITLGQIALTEALTRKLILGTPIYETFATDSNFGRKSAEILNHGFIKWLNKRKQDRPFFAFLNYYDAHDPYLPPPEFATRFSTEPAYGHLTPEVLKERPPEMVDMFRDAYDSSIAYLDDQIGALFVELSVGGVLDNTLVILLADHGEQFGEHDLLSHGNSQYLELLHVPLFLIFPGEIPEGMTQEIPVTLRDIAATMFDLAGIPNPGSFPGTSLKRYWNGSEEEEMLYSYLAVGPGVLHQSKYPGVIESLIYHGLHYIKYSDGVDELYDIQSDSNELENLAADPDNAEILADYKESLKRVKK